MKKIVLFSLLFLMLNASLKADVGAGDGRTQHGVFVREGMVLGRSILNIVGAVVEVVATPAREHNLHSKAWPVTGILRIPNNVIVRAASAVNDIVVYPFVVPFTNDLSPLTEAMGLPEYAWSRI